MFSRNNEMLFIHQLCITLKYEVQLPMLLYSDNTSANNFAGGCTHHVDIRWHFLRDHIQNGTVQLHHIGTDFNLADPFTKNVTPTVFNRHLKHLITD